MLPAKGIEIVAGGGDSDVLAARLAEAAPRAAGIVSFGMGGALDPGLRLGDWVIAGRIVGALEASCDARWVAALAARLPKARTGALHADGYLVSDTAAKTRLAGAGALAVDMESHVAAEAARIAGVPFVALRCISDTAADTLPPAVAVAMRPGGRLAPGAVLASILRRPGQIPALIRVALRFNHAYRVLSHDARNIGARLGFDAR